MIRIVSTGMVSLVFLGSVCHAAGPVVSHEFVYQKAAFDQCHASTIVETTDGTLVSAWFGGTREGQKDVSIWGSRRGRGGAIATAGAPPPLQRRRRLRHRNGGGAPVAAVRWRAARHRQRCRALRSKA